jgi:competence protein ComEC
VIAPVAVLAALIGGILAGDALGSGSAGLLLAAGCAAIVAAVGLRRATRVAVAVAVLGSALLGVAVEQRALHGLAASPLASLTGRYAAVEITARLTSDPDGPQYVTDVLARLATVDGRDAGGRTVLLRAVGDEQSALRVLVAGDRVRLRGRVSPLHGFDTRYRWRHAVAALEVDRVLDVAGPDQPWVALANVARSAVLRGADALPATSRALLAGFVLGDTRAMPPELVDDFRAAGLSHLLAVSGANVAFALAIAEPLLRRGRLGTRLVGGIAVLVLFGTMTRWEPSVLRAAVMAALVMAGRWLGRPTDGGRILVLAMTGLLVVDPFLLHSIGFQLSCGACAGIALLAGPTARVVPGPRWWRDAVGVTTAAQVGVAPVLLATFGTVPLVSLPANLVAAPFVGPLTIWGLVASACGGVLGPGVGRWLQLPTLTMLRAVELVARTAARHPLALDPAAAVVAVAAATCVAFVLRVARRRVGSVGRRGRRVPGQGERPDPARP